MRNTIPKHVGLIPDGNRRWAKAHGLDTDHGYRFGLNRVAPVLDVAIKIGIQELTVYGYSVDNTTRPANEVAGIIEACTRVVNMVQTKPIALQIFGEDQGVFPQMFERYRTRQSLENSKMRLNLLYNYLPENREKSAPIPDLDLVIRTGGCCRLSGFLPEQSRYAELYFLDKLWPDSTADDFEEAVLWYKKQEETVFG